MDTFRHIGKANVGKGIRFIIVNRFGSPGRIRTAGQAINSRLLYRWATGEMPFGFRLYITKNDMQARFITNLIRMSQRLLY